MSPGDLFKRKVSLRRIKYLRVCMSKIKISWRINEIKQAIVTKMIKQINKLEQKTNQLLPKCHLLIKVQFLIKVVTFIEWIINIEHCSISRLCNKMFTLRKLKMIVRYWETNNSKINVVIEEELWKVEVKILELETRLVRQEELLQILIITQLRLRIQL